MSLTAWFVKTFLCKSELTTEDSEEKVKTISTRKHQSHVCKVSYKRDSDYTYQDIIYIDGKKLGKGCVSQNLSVLNEYLKLKHSCTLDPLTTHRLSKLCLLGVDEKIELNSTVIIDLKVSLCSTIY